MHHATQTSKITIPKINNIPSKTFSNFNSKNNLISTTYFSKKFQNIYKKYRDSKRIAKFPSIVEILQDHKTEKIKTMTDVQALKEEIGEEVENFRKMMDMNKKQRVKYNKENLANSSNKGRRISLLLNLSKLEKEGKIGSTKSNKTIFTKNRNNKSEYKSDGKIKNRFLSDLSNNNSGKKVTPINLFLTGQHSRKNNSMKNFINLKTCTNNYLNPLKMFLKDYNGSGIGSVISNPKLDELNRTKQLQTLLDEENDRKKKNIKLNFYEAWKIHREKLNNLCDSVSYNAGINFANGSSYINDFNRSWDYYKKMQEYKNPETKHDKTYY